jgi:hypothetical protein
VRWIAASIAHARRQSTFTKSFSPNNSPDSLDLLKSHRPCHQRPLATTHCVAPEIHGTAPPGPDEVVRRALRQRQQAEPGPHAVVVEEGPAAARRIARDILVSGARTGDRGALEHDGRASPIPSCDLFDDSVV